MPHFKRAGVDEDVSKIIGSLGRLQVDGCVLKGDFLIGKSQVARLGVALLIRHILVYDL